jgi:hypothetical protein
VKAVAAAMLAALAMLVAACGGDDDARSEPRPPVPINVSVQIGEERVTASPRTFGAGQVTLLVNNQSRVSHTLLIEGPRLERTIGPINPQDTATLKVTLQPGVFEVSSEDAAALTPTRLVVGRQRPSAQNELLLP